MYINKFLICIEGMIYFNTKIFCFDAHCRLIYVGKQMNDERIPNEYNIGDGYVLHLVLALGGGC